jgi:5'-phosphate synthase pdxT subunit
LLNERALPRIGVLAIQGDYAAHAEALSETGAIPVEIRKPDQLAGIDGLILPGGESTTILRFLEKRRFFESLHEFCLTHPVFGTCAGTILLAREVRSPAQRCLGVLDAVVERNAYGRQIDSTILTAQTELPGGPLEMVFIRAPSSPPTAGSTSCLSRSWPARLEPPETQTDPIPIEPCSSPHEMKPSAQIATSVPIPGASNPK